MADILEQMGFPKDLSELAIKNSSGLEAAIDLLLQLQTDGAPSACSSQRMAESLSTPTLRLLPVPGTITESQFQIVEHNSAAELCDSARSCSPVSEALYSETIASQSLDEERTTELGFKCQTCSENQSGVDEEIGSARAGPRRLSSESIHPEIGKVRIVDNADAVVPDLFADERKRRVAAALLVKKENEIEKDRIRKQLKEDREMRNDRHNFAARLEFQENATVEHQVCRMEVVGANSTNTGMIELQIRCQNFPMIKASFSAKATLKDVRGFVEQALDEASATPCLEDPKRSNQRWWTPFSGPGAKLTSSRNEELELLRAARDNFKVQTDRIFSEAKSLQKGDSSRSALNQKRGRIYFLVPFPRREFYTESSLDITLSQAQFLPKETLIVQFRPEEFVTATGKNGLSQVLQHAHSINHLGHEGTAQGSFDVQVSALASEVPLTEVSHVAMGSSSNHVAEAGTRITQHQPADKKSHVCNNIRPKGCQNGQSPELTRNKVQMRELALQAAANRMKESAQLFREGLPPDKGEFKGVFQCPSNSEHVYLDCEGDSRKPVVEKAPAFELVQQSLQAGQVETSSQSGKKGRHFSRLEQGPRDLAHSQAVLAAEARLFAAQCPAKTLPEQKHPHPQSNGDRISACMSQQSKVQIPASSRLLRRPEKMQKTVEDLSSTDYSESSNTKHAVLEKCGAACVNFHMFSGAPTNDRHGETSLQSSEMSFRNQVLENNEVIAEQDVLQAFGASSSHNNQTEAANGLSTLRIRLENGSVVTHKCRASTELQLIRDSVVPDDVDPSSFGLVILFPEPRFMIGEALSLTVKQVGLVPRGTLHLSRISTRGMVRQGTRDFQRREQSTFFGVQNEYDEYLEMQGPVTDNYEEFESFLESSRHVYAGVPEEILSALPTQIRKKKGIVGSGEDEGQLCVVCIEELVEGDSVLLLPCLHAFHSACIRQWLRQSRHCPTCKYEVK